MRTMSLGPRTLLLVCCIVAVVFSGCSTGSGSEDISDGGQDIAADAGRGDSLDVVFREVRGDIAEVAPASDGGLPDGLVPSCEPGEGCFLDPCEENADCLSGWCVTHMGQGVCTQTCQDECPSGWICKQVGGTEPDLLFVCVSDYPTLCRPCSVGDDCEGVGGAKDPCVSYGVEGAFCGGACAEDGDCPGGFSCVEVETLGGVVLEQCIADSGVCPCTDTSVELGLWTVCQVDNEWGTCGGVRVCTEEGLSDCDAEVPAEESCNAVDDDCDGETDEGTCDDGNTCTEDQCNGVDGCEYVALNDVECPDGDLCTVGDQCDQGICVGVPVDCDDGAPCTDDVCDPETGDCVHEDNAADCDDGDPCTVADECQGGVCAGVPVSCDCVTDEDCGELEDGDFCNGTLVCDTSTLPYLCEVDPETVITCPAPTEPAAICLAAACDPQTGSCGFAADHEGFPCNNGDPCTAADLCEAGACVGGPPVNCNDGNPCTDDDCDSMEGCVHGPNMLPCEDGDICTVGDLCADGVCVPGGATACDDGNPCTDDSCDPAVGCVFTPNDAPCDDNNLCTEGDLCTGGDCAPGAAVECDDGEVCTTDLCAPVVGCLHVMNSSPCDDGDVCTTGDVCAAGTCVPGLPVICYDDNVCTTDSCDPQDGCVFDGLADGTPCDEGDEHFACVDAMCVCIPDCEDRTCGPDGCGGSCGVCEGEEFCSLGRCMLPLALPDSGMTSCYNNVGVIPCPGTGEDFFGQDASYPTTPMMYNDNGDDTVTDLVTGLVWTRCNAGKTGDDCQGEEAVLTYSDAIAYCDSNQDGLPGEGWRLPNLAELTSIVNFEGPGYKSTPPFGGTMYYAFWATPVGVVDETRCFVSFATGQTACGWLDPEVGQRFRCVRGHERGTGDFVDNADGTVTDLTTNLIWLKDSVGSATWKDALSTCEALEFAGHDDWRLPNARELSTLRDFRNPRKGLHEDIFNGPNSSCWSATTFQGWQYQGSAYGLNTNGTVGYFSDSKYGGKQVRCVRQECTPDCAGKECGDDGCGGTCGACDDVLEECAETATGGRICAAKMVEVPNGVFWMGSPGGAPCPVGYTGGGCDGSGAGTTVAEAGHDPERETLHQVLLTYDLDVQMHEVTQGEWKAAFGGWNPSGSTLGDDHAVEIVSWYDSCAYANWRSVQEGYDPCYEFSEVQCEQGGDPADGSDGAFCMDAEHGGVAAATVSVADGLAKPQDCEGFRLPTEAEWEYAARAGTLSAYHNGQESEPEHLQCEVPFHLTEIAWYCGNNSPYGTKAVGGRLANAWGLKDMSGNVYEWCWDKYCTDNTEYGADPDGSSCGGSSQATRGGYWNVNAQSCRSANRTYVSPGYRSHVLGFRLVRTTMLMCTPDCDDKDCGNDGCGGNCGECNPDLEECTETTTGRWACSAKMVEIPAGIFWMGCNNCAGSTVNDTDCFSTEHSYHEVYLETYEIDRTAVTASQYLACVSTGSCTPVVKWASATYQVAGKEDHPINYVNWSQADAYCQWVGKSLCTEAQWEKGARGGCEYNGGTSNCKAQSRKFPWGNDTPTCSLATSADCPGETKPVCSVSPAGDSPYGLCDMAGNVYEWTADWFGSDYYCAGSSAATTSPWTFCAACGSWPDSPGAWNNPLGAGNGSARVCRGGSFGATYTFLRLSYRNASSPSDSSHSIGGRCCRSDCGDGLCDVDLGEDCSNCIQDCGCGGGEVCEAGECVSCVPDCIDKQCGDDGCGESCGECSGNEECIEGQCLVVVGMPGDPCNSDSDCFSDAECHTNCDGPRV